MIKVALSLRPTHESIATTRRRTTTRHRFSVKASSNNDDDLNDEAKIVAENEQFFINERMESKEDEMELDRRRSVEDMLLLQKEDEKNNVWKTKPFWCQPWTIVLTGVGIISLPTILFDWKAVSGVFVVPIAAWWYIFLYAYPKSYRENGMEEYE